MRYGDASRNKPHIATRRTQAQHLVINPAGLLAGSPTGRTAGGTMSIHRTITVAQGKGGVGKTSLVSNIGGLTAAAGNRVLILDLDQQGNVARDLGYPPDTGDDLLPPPIPPAPPPVLPNLRPRPAVAPGAP